MKKINSNLSKKIYFLNFFFTLCILIHHCNINSIYQIDNIIIKNIIEFVGKIAIPAMPFFFFTSGFLFFYNYTKENCKKKMMERFKTLIVPYIIWNLLAILIIKEFNNITAKEFFKFFILIKNTEPANGALWYIFRLMTYILISPVIYYILKNKKIFIIFILGLMTTNLAFKTEYMGFFYWLPTYMIGAFCSFNYLDYFNKVAATKKAKPLCFWIILFCYILVFCFNLNARIVFLFRTLGIIFFYLGIKHLKIEKISNYIVKTPFFIYCSHIIIVALIKKNIVPRIIVNYDIEYILLYIFIIILSFAIINVLYFILNKFCGKLLYLLTGNRSKREYNQN